MSAAGFLNFIAPSLCYAVVLMPHNKHIGAVLNGDYMKLKKHIKLYKN